MYKFNPNEYDFETECVKNCSAYQKGWVDALNQLKPHVEAMYGLFGSNNLTKRKMIGRILWEIERMKEND